MERDDSRDPATAAGGREPGGREADRDLDVTPTDPGDFHRPETAEDLVDTATLGGSEGDQAPPLADEWIGPYRILDVLGRGGMGTVYRAEQTEPIHRVVALKLIRHGLGDPTLRPRFVAERQALARMSHPNIAQVFEAGDTPDGQPYFVMELVSGEPITAYCDRRRLPLERRLDLLEAVCRGIHHAHQKGILHRDIKPSNILVTEEQGQAMPKIIDFGVAKALDQSVAEEDLTRVGSLIGTPAYLSPESVDSEIAGDPDIRSDVYALGVLLYELLTGVRPFGRPGESFLAVLRRISEEEAPPPSAGFKSVDGDRQRRLAARRATHPAALARRLRGDLDWITVKAMARERERRYDSAAELAADLVAYRRLAPVAAGPPGAVYRWGKFVRRYRAAVAAGLLVAASLVGGIWARTMEAKRANREAAAARQAQSETQQVADFLVRLFEINDPGEALGNTVTARELLDRGAGEIRTRLADQPLTRARLMDTMGVVYRQLGLPQPAVPLIEEVLEVRRRHLGAEHPDTVASRVELGRLYWLAGRYEAAQTTLEEALDQRRRALGPDDPGVAEVLDHLGSVYGIQASWEPAQAAFARALAIREAAFGADAPETASSLDDLGVLLLDRGEPAEAAGYLRRALAIRERVLGPDHPEVASSCNGLALAFEQQGELPEAQRLHERALKIREKVLGADSPDVAQTLTNLARIYFDLGFEDRAESALLRGIDIWERQLGPSHRRIGIAVYNLGDFRRQRGDLATAEESFRRALAIFETSLGPEHPNVAHAAYSLGMVLRDAGRPAEAEELFHRALEIRQVALGVDHPQVVAVRRDYAELLTALGRGEGSRD